MNLKEIVLKSNLYGTRNASICVKGHGYVTAQDIILPHSMEIVDTTQYIADSHAPPIFEFSKAPLSFRRIRGMSSIGKVLHFDRICNLH